MIKWIFIGIDDDFYKILYYGFMKSENYCSVLIPQEKFELDLFEKILLSKKIPLIKMRYRIFNIMRKKRKLRDAIHFADYDYDENVRILIYSRVYERYGDSILKYIDERFVSCIKVCYFGDLISSHKLDISHTKKVFNVVASFDYKEAVNNKLLFVQEPYSYIPQIIEDCEYDVLYVGSSKGRYSKIIKIYEQLRMNNFRCKFYITNVPIDDQKYADEIQYNKRIPYSEVVSLISKSKAILEVVQDGGYSASSRFSEAIVFGKTLITDCEQFKNSNNRTANIVYFENYKSICIEDIKNCIFKYDDLKNERKKLSIEEMINTIEKSIK